MTECRICKSSFKPHPHANHRGTIELCQKCRDHIRVGSSIISINQLHSIGFYRSQYPELTGRERCGLRGHYRSK